MTTTQRPAKMKPYIVQYHIDGYNSPLPIISAVIRARTPNNALATVLRRIGARRGAIAEAKREGGRVLIGKASYNRNRFAWVV